MLFATSKGGSVIPARCMDVLIIYVLLPSDLVRVEVVVPVVVEQDPLAHQHLLLLLVFRLQGPNPCLMFHWNNQFGSNNQSEDIFLPIIAFSFLISEFCSSTLTESFSVAASTSLLHSEDTRDWNIKLSDKHWRIPRNSCLSFYH